MVKPYNLKDRPCGTSNSKVTCFRINLLKLVCQNEIPAKRRKALVFFAVITLAMFNKFHFLMLAWLTKS